MLFFYVVLAVYLGVGTGRVLLRWREIHAGVYAALAIAPHAKAVIVTFTAMLVCISIISWPVFLLYARQRGRCFPDDDWPDDGPPTDRSPT